MASSQRSGDDQNWIVECNRTMVGSGGDTYDPVCELPEGHRGLCRSRSAVDQHKLTDQEYVEMWDA